MEITAAFLKPYFTGNKRRASYKDAKDLYDILRAHTDGEFPTDLIEKRRPSETDDIFEYRKAIYQPITMEPMSAIIRSLGKIRRSPDWAIKYTTENVSAAIATPETLEQYCEYHFPYHTSVTNWAFSILLKNLLIDPNAVCLIAPLNTEVEANNYLKPYPVVYNSNQVYEYIDNEIAILLSTDKTEKNGKVFIIVTVDDLQRWEQVGNSTDYQLTETYAHGLSIFPAFRLPGIFKKAYGTKDIIFTSHIQPIVPRLNEAAREYSDMQAEVVQHVFSEKWEYATQPCEECIDAATGVSTGKIKTGNGKRLITCTKCNGTKTMGAGPYKKIVLRNTTKTNMGEVPIPTPPAGYIQKQIDIVQLQDTRVDKHIYKALSAINMQFLSQIPLSISGDAKEIDRDELNNFVYGIAEDVVKALDQVYARINEYRYGKIVPESSAREGQLPVIPVPEKFDILSTANLVDELQKMHSTQASSIILAAYELDFCNKKFYNNPETRSELEAVMKLDPIPATNDDEKFLRKQGGGVTEIDYVTSCNIVPFVRLAFFKDNNFYTLPFDQQQAVIAGFAQAKIDKVKADEAEQMKKQAAAMATVPAAPPDSN